MARARNIKPGIFKNELLVEQPIFVRLLFIGLWTLADREGRLEDRPKRIRLELFPYDDENVDNGLSVLAELGFITRYEANGEKVIQIINFLKHQTPHGTEKDSVLPDANGLLTVHERTSNGYVTGNKRCNNVKSDQINVNQESNNVHLSGVNGGLDVSEHPDSPNPDSLNTTTNVVVKQKRERKSSRPLPSDFYPDETGVSLAHELRVNIAIELPKFSDYHNGLGNARADWQATWRTWIRNSVKFHPRQQSFSPQSLRDADREAASFALTGRKPVAAIPFEREITGEVLNAA